MSAVSYELNDGVARITMNDGKANIMNPSLLNALIEAFDRARGDNAAVILNSSLPATFSAGFDIKVFAALDPEKSLEMVKSGGELIHTMLTFPRPIIAAAAGRIFPMGLFTLLASDYRLGAHETATWELNEAPMGIVPPRYAFEILAYRLDASQLSRAIMTAERCSPDQGLQAGVFDALAPADQLATEAETIAARLSAIPAAAFAGIKHRLRAEVINAVRTAIDEDETLDNYQKIAASMSA